MQLNARAAAISSVAFAPLFAWLLLVPTLASRLPLIVMLPLVVGFLITSMFALVAGSLALVLSYRRQPPSARRGFAITVAILFVVPWTAWLLLVTHG